MLFDRDFLEDVVSQPQLNRVGELRQVAAEHEEIGRRLHRLNVFNRAGCLLDKPRIDVFWVQVCIRNPGEAKWGFSSERHTQGIDQRKPSVRSYSGHGPGHDRLMEKSPPGYLERWIGPVVRFVQLARSLAPFTLEIAHRFLLPETGTPWRLCRYFFSSTLTLLVFFASTITAVSLTPTKG